MPTKQVPLVAPLHVNLSANFLISFENASANLFKLLSRFHVTLHTCSPEIYKQCLQVKS